VNAALGAAKQNNLDDALPAAIIAVVVVFLLIGLGITIAFLMTLQKALSRCDRRNRTMEPGQVWLNLIPCFNIVWQFITVIRISESLANEFRDRGIRSRDDFGKSLGITTLVLGFLGIIPYIGALFGLAELVCGIIYWVKIAGYSKRLASTPHYDDDADDRDDNEDDYEDRPRKRRREEDDDEHGDDRDRDRGRGKDW
jgi:hypothetical protein